MPTADELVRSFLERENATTRLNYEAALGDFATFVRAQEPPRALERLLAGDAAQANDTVTRWKRSMIGTRDKKGKLIRGRGLSPATVNLRLTVLRGLVRKAYRRGVIAWELDVPGLPAERVHDVRGPGLEALKRILEAARNELGPAGKRNYALLRILAETGLRRRELAGLDLDDVELGDSPALWVLAKGRRQKERVGISTVCAKAISEWIIARPKAPSVALFTNLIPGRLGRISPTAIYDLIAALGRKAGIRKVRGKNRVHPHALRHTVFTEAGREVNRTGLGVETLMKFTRHKDPRVAQSYLDAADDAAAGIGRALATVLDKP
jgi:integrase/recombinase XerC